MGLVKESWRESEIVERAWRDGEDLWDRRAEDVVEDAEGKL